MEVIIVATPDDQARVVADLIETRLTSAVGPILGVATGSSPLPTYRELIRRHQQGRISFARTSMFLLDEYVGLAPDHPEAYRSFIRTNLTDHLDIAPERVHGPDGNAGDLDEACVDYEKTIAAAGGIDLQLLGIGSDGHIGFNEPSSSLGSRTRVKTLARPTRVDNARFFDDDVDAVPRHVLTQGIGTILDARRLVMVASGADKAEPVARMVEGPLTAMVPASALQLHPRAAVVLDEPAAGALTLVDYYRDTYQAKLALDGHRDR